MCYGLDERGTPRPSPAGQRPAGLALSSAAARATEPGSRNLRTSLLLVRGKWRLDLTVRTFTLERPGDYVVCGPGIDHTWKAEADSTMLTIRWPSTK